MAATRWEYCILARLSAGVDTKWHVNQVYQHHENELPTEVTDETYDRYNKEFDALHAAKRYPILPAVLNRLGADGWELLDDMNTGMPGGEGLVFKRLVTGKAKADAKRAKKTSKKR